MKGLLAEPTKDTDKSQWVQVHFCMRFMDGELEKRVKTYRTKAMAKRQIGNWLKKSRENFCKFYEYDTDKWFVSGTL